MKINRELLLNALNMVKPGLSPREFIEQSSCFVFQNKQVMTFNDEVACRKEVELDITGAIQATSLLSILEKIGDPELMVRENDAGELEFKGKRKGFGIIKDAEVFLPIDKVEEPGKWRSLSKEFTEAVGLVQHCVSTDESKFTLTCIQITPEYIQACDNLQIMRCRVKTKIKRPLLVRGASLAHITSLGMDQFSVTKDWIHFKNGDGLIMSVRTYQEEFPDLDGLMAVEGNEITIPKGMKEASECAAVFAMDKSGDPQVQVRLSSGRVQLAGEGLTGWYRETRKINYQGPDISFVIAPELLRHISEKYSEATLTEEKLRAEGGQWEYVTVLGALASTDE